MVLRTQNAWMRGRPALGVAAFVAAMAWSTPAEASWLSEFLDWLAGDIDSITESAACGISDGSIGWVMCTLADSLSGLPGLIAVVAYLAGLIFGLRAILKLKDHVDDPRQVKLDEPGKYALASGLLLSLGFTLHVIRGSLFGAGADTLSNTGFSGTPSAGGLDFVLYLFVADIWWPAHTLLSVFCYIAGLTLALIVLLRLIKDAQEGAKGPAGLGTIGTLFIAGVFLSMDHVLAAFSNSLFAESEVRTAPDLLWATGMPDSTYMHVHAVFDAAVAFFWLIGLVAFIRGWFILRDVAEGGQQASFMAGTTHVIGGALCVNLGPLLEAVQISTGVFGAGVQFV